MTIPLLIIAAFAIQGTSALSAYIVLRVNVPTIHQCAEVCLSLNLCKSLNFDKKNKICHIATKTWMISTLEEVNDFLYAERYNIPQVSRAIVSFIE